MKVNTDKVELPDRNIRLPSNDNSPSATEQYWSNFQQMSPSNSPSQGFRLRSNINPSTLESERSVSRLSAAKEILFGNSRSQSRLFSNQSSPDHVPAFNENNNRGQ